MDKDRKIRCIPGGKQDDTRLAEFVNELIELSKKHNVFPVNIEHIMKLFDYANNATLRIDFDVKMLFPE